MLPMLGGGGGRNWSPEVRTQGVWSPHCGATAGRKRGGVGARRGGRAVADGAGGRIGRGRARTVVGAERQGRRRDGRAGGDAGGLGRPIRDQGADGGEAGGV